MDNRKTVDLRKLIVVMKSLSVDTSKVETLLEEIRVERKK